MREQNTKKCVSKFISDKLRNSMIVNLAKNRFLQQHQKTELINWDWFVILHGLYAAETKLLQKMYSYDNILSRDHPSYFSFN